MIRRAAVFKLAEESTMQGLFPPSSRVTGVRLLAAAARTFRPTALLPVKKILSKGSAVRAAAVSASPRQTATYSGEKSSSSSAQITRAVLPAS